MIEIVSATRLSEVDFWSGSALGRSLKRLAYDTRLTTHITFTNRRGLPDIYNPRIVAVGSEEVLLFIHDDVWIDDYFLADHLLEGLETYDLLGLAGNRRRVPRQALWASVDEVRPDREFALDDSAYLSGTVAHGPDACTGVVSFYGAAPAACELMDGLFLAARKSVLVANGVLFDPRFDFHFYDLDFCRNAKQHGLRVGTWPIAVTHQSGGVIDERWVRRYEAYIEKWGE